MEHVSALQLLLLGLLTTVAFVAVLARRLSVSYPILLVLAGLLCSLLPHVPRVALPPGIVFYVFLPPLLYAAAWQTSWREFRNHIVSISMLAVGLVFFTAIGIAFAAHLFMPGFDWRLGFLLGAIVSPTDAVAATSIARRVGMPHSITDILEGESLVNDATGLLALQFGIDMIVDRSIPTLGKGAADFVWLLGGGVAIGLLIGWLMTRVERFIEDGPVDIVISIIIAYVAYLAGEAARASGVIAVVACGLYLSRRSDKLFSPQTRLQIWGVWEALEFLLNGLVFLLIGLQLPYVLEAIQGYSHIRLLTYGLLFSVVLIALRLVWVYPSLSLAAWVRTRLLHHSYRAPNPKATFVLGWTGMRGVVALAAAGSLPATIADGTPFPQSNMILFLTFAVILVTLVLQGLTLPATVRALGFDGDTGPACEEEEARRLLLQAAISFVETQRATQTDSDERQHYYDDMLHQFRHRMEELSAQPTESSDQTATRKLLLDAHRAERDKLVDLRATGRIGDGVYRTLERELDLIESRLESQQ